MKRWSMYLLAAVMSGLVARADDPSVQVGASLDEVIAALGQPEGLLRMDDRIWLTYPRGTVKLSGGQVESAELVSCETAARRQAETDRARAQAEVVRREEAARRYTSGCALKQARLSDPLFLSLSAASQADYWRRFMAAYPGVPVEEEYHIAMIRAREEERTREEQAFQERRLRELENRVARAERDREQHVRVIYSTPFYGWRWPVGPCQDLDTPHVPLPEANPVITPARARVFTFGKTSSSYPLVAQSSY